ncbi:MAG TPA: GreA/GreB family elongation factor [Candidatus Eisenbacteria bacterium]|jgi:transcription elongation factor GreA
MPIRQDLPPVLRGDAAVDPSPESRARLERLAEDARQEGLLVFARDECAARLKQPRPSAGVEYLLAWVCALNGERERALQTLLALGERLALERAWEPLAAVAEQALELGETAAGAQLLVNAHEGLGQDPARIEALRRAWSVLPDDLDLGLRLAIRLGEAGLGVERRALLAELAPRFAAERRTAGLEEAALEFVEHRDLEGLLRVIHVLPEVAAGGAFADAKQILEVALPPVSAAGRAGDVLEPLRRIVRLAAEARGPALAEEFRAGLIESVKQGPARLLPDAAQVLSASGIEDRSKPLLPALERFDAIAVLPPGRAVLHGSFGAGRIRADDGESVVIDFVRSPGHRMPYPAARRTVTPLDEDDLRLLQFTAPAELERLRREQPGEILVRALRAMGGEADAQRLKLFLVGHGLVPVGEWTRTFRSLQSAAEGDARIDHARAFERHYRLVPEGQQVGDAEAPLPALEPRKPLKANLATLRKFLGQHPQAEPALAQRFGKYVERALFDGAVERADRARAGLRFARWFPERSGEWIGVLKSLWDQGLVVSDLGSEDEQLGLLEASHAAGVEGEAILSGLDSRFSSVRDAAARYRDRLDRAGRDALRRILLDHAPRHPQAALRLIEQELTTRVEVSPEPAEETPADVGAAHVWRLAWATLALIEERPKPSVAEKVLSWIVEGGPLDRLIAGRPCPADQRLRVSVLLRQWRSSDRYLFPALEAAERLGLGDAVTTVREARERRTQKMFDQVGQQAEGDLPVMTRSTWERLKKELDRLERELKTTIPATIQRARELGDLRENAEYHSAKLKQANVSKQVAALQRRLARARFVEDAELKDGVVGLGTEVVLEGEHDITIYWILGDSEQHHGGHVVSFQAPVGRALMGKTIGDEVELGAAGERRVYRVVSVERKLPPEGGDAA